jgi:hypothetical protein
MKAVVFLFAMSLSGLFVSAQIYVYPTDRMYFGEMLFSVQNGHVILGNSNMWSDAVYTAQNGRVFKGFSTSTFNVLYSIQDGRVYIGESRFSSDIQFTIKNGKLYKGDSDMMMDCLFTYDAEYNRILKGESKFPMDAVLFCQGEILSNAELLAVLLATKML